MTANQNDARDCLGCGEPFTDQDPARSLCLKCRRKPYTDRIDRGAGYVSPTGYTTDRYGGLVVDGLDQRSDRRGPNR